MYNVNDEKEFLRKFGEDTIKENGHLLKENGEFTIGAMQLRALWTSFCIHRELEVDTNLYDAEIAELWNTIVLAGVPAEGPEFENFDAFMAEYLC